MNPPNLLKFCFKMWSFLTSVFSPEHSVVVQAPLVQGCPLFHESGPDALPLPMGTRWIWHTKQARPGLHSASQCPRQAHVSGSWDGPLSNPGGSYMNALPDRGDPPRLLHEVCCGRLCSHRATILVPLMSPSRFATWGPDRAQETERALSPSVPLFPQSASPPLHSFSSACPSLFQQCPSSRLGLAFCLLRTDSSGHPPLGSTNHPPLGSTNPPPSCWSTPLCPSILLEHSHPPSC